MRTKDTYDKHFSFLNPTINTYSDLDSRRILEIIVSSILLILSLPILLLFIVLIKIESSGPVFYRQVRVGLNGRTFNIAKLRSMRVDAEVNGPQFASKNDPRITRVGSFIRKTRIDEVPQLLNVLRGDMSLVGPRPERPIFTEQLAGQIKGFKDRLKVKPGLTGWAQVNGGYDISHAEKYSLDMYYIGNRSLLLDCKIILATIWVVLSGSGAR